MDVDRLQPILLSVLHGRVAGPTEKG